MDRGYPRALRQTLRTTAAAYGYTLTIATTITVLSSVHGKPESGDVFMFVAGGLAAFAGLEAVLVGLGGMREEEASGQAFAFAGALNFFSVPAALGASVGIAHGIETDIAWLLAPLAATAVYMLVVAVQVRLVAGRD